MSMVIDDLYVYEDMWGNQIPYYYLAAIASHEPDDDEDIYAGPYDERIEDVINHWEWKYRML